MSQLPAKASSGTQEGESVQLSAVGRLLFEGNQHAPAGGCLEEEEEEEEEEEKWFVYDLVGGNVLAHLVPPVGFSAAPRPQSITAA